MTLRQGLALGTKQTRSAEWPAFRALLRQNLKLRHDHRCRGLDRPRALGHTAAASPKETDQPL